MLTSPPYWRLRDYQINGQIGLEATPEEYLDRLLGVFDEAEGCFARTVPAGSCSATPTRASA